MSKYDWPDNTASPEYGGTHLVVKGDRTYPKRWQFLLIPSNPDARPMWTDIREKAGIWSQHDAELLAKMRGGALGARGIEPEAWAQEIPPPTEPQETITIWAHPRW
jgi:hypothetical protein